MNHGERGESHDREAPLLPQGSSRDALCISRHGAQHDPSSRIEALPCWAASADSTRGTDSLHAARPRGCGDKETEGIGGVNQGNRRLDSSVTKGRRTCAVIAGTVDRPKRLSTATTASAGTNRRATRATYTPACAVSDSWTRASWERTLRNLRPLRSASIGDCVGT